MLWLLLEMTSIHGSTEEFTTHHPGICHSGILRILSKRYVKISRCTLAALPRAKKELAQGHMTWWQHWIGILAGSVHSPSHSVPSG